MLRVTKGERDDGCWRDGHGQLGDWSHWAAVVACHAASCRLPSSLLEPVAAASADCMSEGRMRIYSGSVIHESMNPCASSWMGIVSRDRVTVEAVEAVEGVEGVEDCPVQEVRT